MNITFITFNIGLAGPYANGPGMSLYNLVRYIKQCSPEYKVDIFSAMPFKSFDKDIRVMPISNIKSLKKSIYNCDILHHWSGINDSFFNAIDYAKKIKKRVIIGPNVLDCVEEDKERNFISNLKFDLILSVNSRLKYLISKTHNINIEIIKTLIVGPDTDMWAPIDSTDHSILWKGNSRHFVKDINFALEVRNKMRGKYKFKFIGHPNPYDYFSHINDAKNSKIYFSTSLSETKGMALMEQWAAGIPSITHPNIYMHGENYKTGIIANRSVASYCDAIDEIMSDERLYLDMSAGCRKYMVDNFSPLSVYNSYDNILRCSNVG